MSVFLLRDRDFLTDEAVQNIERRSAGKLFVLGRHELENYFLVPELPAHVLEELYDKRTTVEQAREHLRVAAHATAGNALRDMVAFRLNMLFRPEDFTVPPLMREVRLFDDKGWRATEQGHLREMLSKRYAEVVEAYEQKKANTTFDALFEQCSAQIDRALRHDEPHTLMPGKEVLLEVGRKLGLGDQTVLQNALIKGLADVPALVAPDLRSIFDIIAEGITPETA